MTAAIHSTRETKGKKETGLMQRHPYLANFAVSIGVPVLILAVVFLGTAAVLLPVSLLMGWL